MSAEVSGAVVNLRTLVAELRRDHPRFGAAFLLLLFVFLGGLFIPGWLPFVDWGAQAGELAVMARWGETGLGLQGYYQLQWLHGATPLRLILTPVAWLLGADLAMRVALATCLLLQALFAVSILRRRGLTPWPAVMVFPGLYSYPLLFGQLDMVVGATCVFGALASWEKRHSTPGRRPALCWAGACLAAALVEPFAGIVAVSALAFLTILQGLEGDSPRAALRALGRLAVAALPALLVVVIELLRAAQWPLDGDINGRAPESQHLAHRLQLMLRYAGFLWRSTGFDRLLVWGIVLIPAAALLPRPSVALATQRGQSSWLPAALAPWARRLWDKRYGALTLALVVAYFWLPASSGTVFDLPPRAMALVIMVLPLAVAHAAAWGRRPFIVAATVWVTLWGALIGMQLSLFSIEVEEFAQVEAAIPKGARVRCHVSNNRSTVLTVPTYRHFCGYLLARRGGLNGFLFRHRGIDYRAGYEMPMRSLYRWQDRGVGGFDHQRFGDRFDYFVVRPRRRFTPFHEPPLAATVRLLLRTRNWAVYRRVGAMKLIRPPSGPRPR